VRFLSGKESDCFAFKANAQVKVKDDKVHCMSIKP